MVGCGLFLAIVVVGVALVVNWARSYGKDPEVFETIQQPGGTATRLTYHRTCESLALSPDGKQIAWTSFLSSPVEAIGPLMRTAPALRRPGDEQAAFDALRRSGILGQLHTMDPDGHNKRTLQAGPIMALTTCVSWSPDGTKIAVAGMSEGSTPEAARLDIWVYDFTTVRAAQVTSAGGADFPLFSPDGEWIAYARSEPEDQYGPAHLWVCRSDGSDRRQVSDVLIRIGPSLKDWSPDSERLVFVSSEKQAGQADEGPRKTTAIHTVRVDGEDERQVFAGPASWAKWSEDGEQILFAHSSKQGHKKSGEWLGNVGTISVKSGQVDWLATDVAGHFRHAVYCPDAHVIIYCLGSATGGANLHALNLASGKTRQLTDCGDVWGMPGDIDASPDGRTILFIRDLRNEKGRRGTALWKLNVTSTESSKAPTGGTP